MVVAQMLQTSEILTELAGGLSPAEEVKTIAHIQSLQKEVDSIYAHRREDGIRIIREMTTVAEKKKHEAERKGEAEHKARMNELEKERIRVIKHNQDMEQQCNRLEKETAEAKKNKEELQRKIKETEDAKNILLPRVKDALSLFSLISSIRWDYDAQDKVKGYIANNTDVKPFNMDSSSSFSTANALWDLLE